MENAKKPKVLLVEDDNIIVQTFKPELELSGYEILVAGDGKTGIDMAKREKPDIILLDLMLPIMNGLEVLKALKRDDEVKGIPVMILTNYGSDENVKTALDVGAADFVLKYRYTPAEIAAKIKEVLQNPAAS